MSVLKKVLLSLRSVVLFASGALSVLGLCKSYEIMNAGWLIQVKFWTNWSVLSHVFASFSQCFLGLFYVFGHIPKPSRHRACERMFVAASGLCTCVSIMFWGLFLQDPKNIFQSAEAAEAVPMFWQHSVHTFPASGLLLDIIFWPSMHKPIISLLEEYLIPAVITALFCGQTFLIGLKLYDPNSPLPILRVQWPYGFMDQLDLLGWVILLGGVFTLIFIVQFILRAIRIRSFRFSATPLEAFEKEHEA